MKLLDTDWETTLKSRMSSQLIPNWEKVLDGITLGGGSHSTRDDGVCAMEAVSWLGGERHSSTPQCADRCIRSFVIPLNDSAPNHKGRQRLKPYLPLIVGTKNDGQGDARSLLLSEATRTTPSDYWESGEWEPFLRKMIDPSGKLWENNDRNADKKRSLVEELAELESKHGFKYKLRRISLRSKIKALA